MNRTAKFALIVVGVFIVMRLMSIDLKDIPDVIMARLSRAATDANALVNGDYSQQTAAKAGTTTATGLRAAADNISISPSGAGGGDELQRELAAERKRFLTEKANQAEQVVGRAVRGDMDALKRQVEQNARTAGGEQ